MTHLKTILLVLFTSFFCTLSAQNNDQHIAFNDKKNTVHGVYIGVGGYYGTIDNKDTYSTAVKVAYVANKQFEIGFAATGFYTDENEMGFSEFDNDIVGVYGGIHLEPILFSKSRVNLSFPLLTGAGAVTTIEETAGDYDAEDWDPIFVVEPGVSIQYHINRFIQIEASVKHRFSSKVNFVGSDISKINGVSAGIGIKIGVFNI